MSLKRPITLLLPLVALLGCGVGTTAVSNPATPNLSGNWQIQIQTTVTPPISFLFNFLGALNVQGSTATGTFRVSGTQPGSSCPSSTQDIALTGSIDTNNLLTLTSAPFSGSVATLQLQLPLDAASIANGTVKIVGGVCALPSAFVVAVFVPPITGTYAGTITTATDSIDITTGIVTPIPGISGPATISFTQSPADADGRFPVTANVSLTSPACTITSTLTGFANGLGLELDNGLVPPSGSPSLLLNGAIPPALIPTFHADLVVSSPGTSSCTRGIYTGTLTHQ